MESLLALDKDAGAAHWPAAARRPRGLQLAAGGFASCTSLALTRRVVAAKQSTGLLRCPSLIPCPRLAAEVVECLRADHNYSPRADAIKTAFGLEFEHRLNEMLSNAGAAPPPRFVPPPQTAQSITGDARPGALPSRCPAALVADPTGTVPCRLGLLARPAQHKRRALPAEPTGSRITEKLIRSVVHWVGQGLCSARRMMTVWRARR